MNLDKQMICVTVARRNSRVFKTVITKTRIGFLPRMFIDRFIHWIVIYQFSLIVIG